MEGARRCSGMLFIVEGGGEGDGAGLEKDAEEVRRM